MREAWGLATCAKNLCRKPAIRHPQSPPFAVTCDINAVPHLMLRCRQLRPQLLRLCCCLAGRGVCLQRRRQLLPARGVDGGRERAWGQDRGITLACDLVYTVMTLL